MLKALTPEVEQRFTQCGATLHEQVRLSAQLQQQNERLRTLSQALDSDQSSVRQLATLSERELGHCDEVSAQVAWLSDSLATHGDRVDALVQEQQSLLQIFAPLKALQSFFRIESATLPPDLQGSFHAVTEEVSRLDIDIRSSFEQQARELGVIRREVAVTTTGLRKKASELTERAVANRQAITNALNNIAAERDTGQRREAVVASSAQQIDREIDAISVSLQYQDITRQKLEHVLTAIDQIISDCGTAIATPPAARLKVACRMQAMQLQAIDQDLSKAGETVTRGLEGIIGQLTNIEAQGISVDSQQQSVERMRQVMHALLNDHRALQAALAQSLVGLEEAIATTRRFASTTTAATGTMRQLAADLRMMGLNAQVQSVQVNHGGLEVLSGEASRISIEAGERIQTFETHLVEAAQSLNDAIGRVQAVADAIRTRADGAHEETAASATLEDELTQRGDAIRAATELLGQLGQQAQNLGESANLAAIDRSPLTDTAATLTTLATLFAAEAPDGTETADTFGNLHGHYTMESERKIHEAALIGATVAAAATTAAAAPGADTVDFFDAEPSAPPADEPINVTPSAATTPESAPATESDSTKVKPTSADTNIEFF